MGSLGRGGMGKSSVLVQPHGLDLWRKIGSGSAQFLDCIKWKLGRGNCIHFWDDDWSGRGTLRDQFPRIYALAIRKDVVVEEDGRSGWNLNCPETLMIGRSISL